VLTLECEIKFYEMSRDVLHLQETWTYDIWVQVGSVCRCVILMPTVKQVKLEYPKTRTGYVQYWWCTIFLILQYIEGEENCIQHFGVEYSGKSPFGRTRSRCEDSITTVDLQDRLRG